LATSLLLRHYGFAHMFPGMEILPQTSSHVTESGHCDSYLKEQFMVYLYHFDESQAKTRSIRFNIDIASLNGLDGRVQKGKLNITIS